jgi:uncharacterized membrane protein YuzA (DUF378 family)
LYSSFFALQLNHVAPDKTGVGEKEEEEEQVMKQIDVIAAVLVVVGALNWGLVALARFDLVAALFGMSFGEVSPLTAVVYGLVGLAGAYQALFWKRVQSRWAHPAAQHAR